MFLVSRLQSSVVTTAWVTSVSFFQTCHSFKALLLSRPPFFVATSASVATSRCCRDIVQLSFWLITSCLPCDPCRDLHQVPSVFLMSRRHSWTMQTQNRNINQPVSFVFVLPIELHFYSTNCCIFLLLFLLSSTLPANNKLVSFFIFLHINYSF